MRGEFPILIGLSHATTTDRADTLTATGVLGEPGTADKLGIERKRFGSEAAASKTESAEDMTA